MNFFTFLHYLSIPDSNNKNQLYTVVLLTMQFRALLQSWRPSLKAHSDSWSRYDIWALDSVGSQTSWWDLQLPLLCHCCINSYYCNGIFAWSDALPIQSPTRMYKHRLRDYNDPTLNNPSLQSQDYDLPILSKWNMKSKWGLRRTVRIPCSFL